MRSGMLTLIWIKMALTKTKLKEDIKKFFFFFLIAVDLLTLPVPIPDKEGKLI